MEVASSFNGAPMMTSGLPEMPMVAAASRRGEQNNGSYHRYSRGSKGRESLQLQLPPTQAAGKRPYSNTIAKDVSQHGDSQVLSYIHKKLDKRREQIESKPPKIPRISTGEGNSSYTHHANLMITTQGYLDGSVIVKDEPPSPTTELSTHRSLDGSFKQEPPISTHRSLDGSFKQKPPISSTEISTDRSVDGFVQQETPSPSTMEKNLPGFHTFSRQSWSQHDFWIQKSDQVPLEIKSDPLPSFTPTSEVYTSASSSSFSHAPPNQPDSGTLNLEDSASASMTNSWLHLIRPSSPRTAPKSRLHSHHHRRHKGSSRHCSKRSRHFNDGVPDPSRAPFQSPGSHPTYQPSVETSGERSKVNNSVLQKPNEMVTKPSEKNCNKNVLAPQRQNETENKLTSNDATNDDMSDLMSEFNRRYGPKKEPYRFPFYGPSKDPLKLGKDVQPIKFKPGYNSVMLWGQ